MWVRRVFPLGRIDEEHIPTHFKTSGLNPWQQLFFGSPGVSRALQADDLAAPQVGYNGFGRLQHEPQVRFSMAVKRCRHTENYGIQLLDCREVRRRIEILDQRVSHFIGFNVFDITLSGVQRVDLAVINVQSCDGVSISDKMQRQRQAYVAQSDNTDPS